MNAFLMIETKEGENIHIQVHIGVCERKEIKQTYSKKRMMLNGTTLVLTRFWTATSSTRSLSKAMKHELVPEVPGISLFSLFPKRTCPTPKTKKYETNTQMNTHTHTRAHLRIDFKDI